MPSSARPEAGIDSEIFSRGGLLRDGVRDAGFCDCLDLRFVLLKNVSGVDNIGRGR